MAVATGPLEVPSTPERRPISRSVAIRHTPARDRDLRALVRAVCSMTRAHAHARVCAHALYSTGTCLCIHAHARSARTRTLVRAPASDNLQPTKNADLTKFSEVVLCLTRYSPRKLFSTGGSRNGGLNVQ